LSLFIHENKLKKLRRKYRENIIEKGVEEKAVVYAATDDCLKNNLT
jgi:hypothetical protein